MLDPKPLKYAAVTLVFAAALGKVIYDGYDYLYREHAAKPVAGVDKSTPTVEVTQIDCGERMPRFDTNEVCAPSKTEIMLGKYEAPTRQP